MGGWGVSGLVPVVLLASLTTGTAAFSKNFVNSSLPDSKVTFVVNFDFSQVICQHSENTSDLHVHEMSILCDGKQDCFTNPAMHDESFPYCEKKCDSTCNNRGACLYDGHRPQCYCNSGFSGPSCEFIDKNECLDRPCHLMADCLNTPVGFSCICRSGFHGDGYHCADIDECTTPTLCPEHSTCVNLPGTHYCNCTQGFVQKGDTLITKCVDINECELASHNCGKNQLCENTIGGFTCVSGCTEGYELVNGECIDVDECRREDVCGPRAECFNSPGSYSCVCEEGMTGDGQRCEPITDCTQREDICDRHAQCIHPFKMCQCVAGFVGDGITCHDIDECEAAAEPCKNQKGTRCVNIVGGHICCEEGSDDARCIEQKGVFCAGGCGMNAFCGNKTCECLPGYSGDPLKKCLDVNECDADNICHGVGQWCVNVFGSFLCCSEQSKEPECQGVHIFRSIDGTTALLNTNHTKEILVSAEQGEHGVTQQGGFIAVGKGVLRANGSLPSISVLSKRPCTSYCPINSECVSGYCQCSKGYGGNPHLGCEDVNECLAGSPCGVETPDSWCVNTEGSFSCCTRNSTEDSCMGLEIVRDPAGHLQLVGGQGDDETIFAASINGTDREEVVSERIHEFQNASEGGAILLVKQKTPTDVTLLKPEEGEMGLEIRADPTSSVAPTSGGPTTQAPDSTATLAGIISTIGGLSTTTSSIPVTEIPIHVPEQKTTVIAQNKTTILILPSTLTPLTTIEGSGSDAGELTTPEDGDMLKEGTTTTQVALTPDGHINVRFTTLDEINKSQNGTKTTAAPRTVIDGDGTGEESLVNAGLDKTKGVTDGDGAGDVKVVDTLVGSTTALPEDAPDSEKEGLEIVALPTKGGSDVATQKPTEGEQISAGTRTTVSEGATTTTASTTATFTQPRGTGKPETGEDGGEKEQKEKDATTLSPTTSKTVVSDREEVGKGRKKELTVSSSGEQKAPETDVHGGDESDSITGEHGTTSEPSTEETGLEIVWNGATTTPLSSTAGDVNSGSSAVLTTLPSSETTSGPDSGSSHPSKEVAKGESGSSSSGSSGTLITSSKETGTPASSKHLTINSSGEQKAPETDVHGGDNSETIQGESGSHPTTESTTAETGLEIVGGQVSETASSTAAPSEPQEPAGTTRAGSVRVSIGTTETSTAEGVTTEGTTETVTESTTSEAGLEIVYVPTETTAKPTGGEATPSATSVTTATSAHLTESSLPAGESGSTVPSQESTSAGTSTPLPSGKAEFSGTSTPIPSKGTETAGTPTTPPSKEAESPSTATSLPSKETESTGTSTSLPSETAESSGTTTPPPSKEAESPSTATPLPSKETESTGTSSSLPSGTAESSGTTTPPPSKEAETSGTSTSVPAKGTETAITTASLPSEGTTTELVGKESTGATGTTEPSTAETGLEIVAVTSTPSATSPAGTTSGEGSAPKETSTSKSIGQDTSPASTEVSPVESTTPSTTEPAVTGETGLEIVGEKTTPSAKTSTTKQPDLVLTGSSTTSSTTEESPATSSSATPVPSESATSQAPATESTVSSTLEPVTAAGKIEEPITASTTEQPDLVLNASSSTMAPETTVTTEASSSSSSGTTVAATESTTEATTSGSTEQPDLVLSVSTSTSATSGTTEKVTSGSTEQPDLVLSVSTPAKTPDTAISSTPGLTEQPDIRTHSATTVAVPPTQQPVEVTSSSRSASTISASEGTPLPTEPATIQPKTPGTDVEVVTGNPDEDLTVKPSTQRRLPEGPAEPEVATSPATTKETFSLPEKVTPSPVTLGPSNVTKCVSSDECGDDALCERRTGACRCLPGFQGAPPTTICTDVDECAEGLHKCHETARCQNIIGTYACFCPMGYRKNELGVCVDIDECAESRGNCCSLNGTCVNKQGSYGCECKPGFFGDGYKCMPVEKRSCTEAELAKSGCGQHHVCGVDGAGNVDCNSCKMGFKMVDGNCTDLNECSEPALNMCSPSAECNNLLGTYACSCKEGFKGDGYMCEDIDECANSPCHPQAECENILGGYKCSCPSGFTGDGIKECTNPLERSCENVAAFCGRVEHTACLSVRIFNGSLTSVCECEPGYRFNKELNKCQDINECDENRHNCDPASSVCVNEDGGFHCDCAEGYEGKGGVCVDVNECERGTAGCHSMAMCLNQPGSCGCKCMQGFTGDGIQCNALQKREEDNSCTAEWDRLCLLENKTCHVDEEDVPQCGSCIEGHHPINGSCQPVHGAGTCADPSKNTCHKHAECIDIPGIPGKHFCTCKKGFIGDGIRCDDIDECSLTGICNPHAACLNLPGSFNCTCNPGYIGNGFTCTKDIGPNCHLNAELCHKDADCTMDGQCKCRKSFEGDGFKDCKEVAATETSTALPQAPTGKPVTATPEHVEQSTVPTTEQPDLVLTGKSTSTEPPKTSTGQGSVVEVDKPETVEMVTGSARVNLTGMTTSSTLAPATVSLGPEPPSSSQVPISTTSRRPGSTEAQVTVTSNEITSASSNSSSSSTPNSVETTELTESSGELPTSTTTASLVTGSTDQSAPLTVETTLRTTVTEAEPTRQTTTVALTGPVTTSESTTVASEAPSAQATGTTAGKGSDAAVETTTTEATTRGETKVEITSKSPTVSSTTEVDVWAEESTNSSRDEEIGASTSRVPASTARSTETSSRREEPLSTVTATPSAEETGSTSTETSPTSPTTSGSSKSSESSQRTTTEGTVASSSQSPSSGPEEATTPVVQTSTVTSTEPVSTSTHKVTDESSTSESATTTTQKMAEEETTPSTSAGTTVEADNQTVTSTTETLPSSSAPEVPTTTPKSTVSSPPESSSPTLLTDPTRGTTMEVIWSEEKSSTAGDVDFESSTTRGTTSGREDISKRVVEVEGSGDHPTSQGSTPVESSQSTTSSSTNPSLSASSSVLSEKEAATTTPTIEPAAASETTTEPKETAGTTGSSENGKTEGTTPVSHSTVTSAASSTAPATTGSTTESTQKTTVVIPTRVSESTTSGSPQTVPLTVDPTGTNDQSEGTTTPPLSSSTVSEELSTTLAQSSSSVQPSPTADEVTTETAEPAGTTESTEGTTAVSLSSVEPSSISTVPPTTVSRTGLTDSGSTQPITSTIGRTGTSSIAQTAETVSGSSTTPPSIPSESSSTAGQSSSAGELTTEATRTAGNVRAEETTVVSSTSSSTSAVRSSSTTSGVTTEPKQTAGTTRPAVNTTAEETTPSTTPDGPSTTHGEVSSPVSETTTKPGQSSTASTAAVTRTTQLEATESGSPSTSDEEKAPSPTRVPSEGTTVVGSVPSAESTVPPSGSTSLPAGPTVSTSSATTRSTEPERPLKEVQSADSSVGTTTKPSSSRSLTTKSVPSTILTTGGLSEEATSSVSPTHVSPTDQPSTSTYPTPTQNTGLFSTNGNTSPRPADPFDSFNASSAAPPSMTPISFETTELPVPTIELEAYGSTTESSSTTHAPSIVTDDGVEVRTEAVGSRPMKPQREGHRRCSAEDRSKCHEFAICDLSTSSCRCKDGFEGDGYTNCRHAPTTDCLSNSTICHSAAFCDRHTRKCACNAGYIGDGILCSPDPQDCLLRKDLCSSDAVCSGRRCHCIAGFTGDGVKCVSLHQRSANCSECDINAHCDQGVCSCNLGYFGNGLCCVPDPRDCVHFPGVCHPEASCNRESRQCTCRKGFLGDGISCFPAVSCVTDSSVCDKNAICLPSGHCMCRTGFEGNGHTCRSTSAFALRTVPHDTPSLCGNKCNKDSELCIEGTCVCKHGYNRVNEVCQDIDECLSSPCHQLASCQNTKGSYSCSCPEGYVGDGKTCLQHLKIGELGVFCENDGMTLVLSNDTQLFEGKMYVRGQAENPNCVKTFSPLQQYSRPYTFKVYFEHCNVQLLENNTFATTVIVQKHPHFITTSADSYDLKCSYNPGITQVQSHVNVSELAPTSTLSNQFDGPTCSLKITDDHDDFVESAKVGQSMVLRLEVAPNATYGILPRDCVAVNIETGERYQLTDKHGCAVDDQLFPEFVQLNPSTTQAVFRTFKWPDSSMIRFQCDCKACVGACPAPDCRRKTLPRFRRAHHGSLDEQQIDDEVEQKVVDTNRKAFSRLLTVQEDTQEQMAQEEVDHWNRGRSFLAESLPAVSSVDNEGVCVRTAVLAGAALLLVLSIGFLTSTALRRRGSPPPKSPDSPISVISL